MNILLAPTASSASNFARVILLLSLLCATCQLRAQDRPELCDTDSLVISTGWDRLQDSLGIYNRKDLYWEVVRVQSNPPPPKIAPWPAEIVSFARIGDMDCQIISAYKSYTKPDTVNGTYTFETSFCVTGIVSEARLVCNVAVPRYSRVTLNGIPILERSGPHPHPRIDDAPEIDVDITGYVSPGRNRIQVELAVPESESTAFALAGFITAKSEETETPFSCDQCGEVPPKRYE